MSSTGLLLLLVIVGLSVAPIESSFSPQAESSLYAVWSSSVKGVSTVNLTQIDPATGDVGKNVFSRQGLLIVLELTPAVDTRGKRVFVPLYENEESVLAVFDFSTVEPALTSTIPLPSMFFSGVQYDPVKDLVWLITRTSAGGENNFVVAVDLKTGWAEKVKNLPAGSAPLFTGTGGAPVAFEQKTRKLIYTSKTSASAYVLESFNVDTLTFASRPLTSNQFPVALARDTKSEVIYALFGASADKSPLSFGTISSTTQSVTKKWTATDPVTVVGSLAAVDPSTTTFYTVAARNSWPIVNGLVSVNAKSGSLQNNVGFSNGADKPLGLFVL